MSHLSFSRLNQYYACPLKYRNLFVDAVPEPDVTPAWEDAPKTVGSGDQRMEVASAFAREFGSCVHAALRDWQRAVDGGARPTADRLIDLVAKAATAASLDAKEIDRTLGRIRAHLGAYAEGPWPRRRTLFLEQEVRHELVDSDGFALELHVRVDRVVRYRRGVAILDFKTVKPHAFQLHADEWQLRTYAIAAPDLVGVQPGAVALFVIDLGSGRDIEVGHDAAALDEARRELLDCARGIAAGNFSAALQPGRPCWECGFRLQCPDSLSGQPPRPRVGFADAPV